MQRAVVLRLCPDKRLGFTGRDAMGFVIRSGRDSRRYFHFVEAVGDLDQHFGAFKTIRDRSKFLNNLCNHGRILAHDNFPIHSLQAYDKRGADVRPFKVTHAIRLLLDRHTD